MFATMSVDKFSFPSGHSTRAVALGLFFFCLYPLSIVFSLPVLVWSAAVLCAYAPLDRWVAEGVWHMPASLQVFEYSVVGLALILDPRRPTFRGAGLDGKFRM